MVKTRYVNSARCQNVTCILKRMKYFLDLLNQLSI